MHILGTAGHVDHGKSSLVRALTGTNPDRWLEEQLRGMTLDLGFARLRFDDGVEAGIVDVPGHERFLHNMLAGAAGMEILLLVVAANEGPKPQTFEHLAILGYLNVQRVIIVLTKSDLVDAEELAFAEELVREAVRGTVAQDAQAIGVSTVTGAGLDALRVAIHDALVELPPRLPQAPPYLPIDRVFALAGHGTIVTGTLMQGALAVGDRLVLQPSGREVRLRSLQVFGEKRERVDGGSRVAANLPGIEVGEIARGEVLTSPEFRPGDTFDVTFRPYGPGVDMLRRRTPVRAYIGSAEIIGTLLLRQPPRAGEDVAATLHLRRPAAVFPGAAFVVRRLSPKDLLGGGTIAAARDDAASETQRSPEERAVLQALAAAGLAALTPAQIAAAANVREERVDALLGDLLEAGAVSRVQKPVAYLDAPAARTFFERVLERLSAAERETPWVMGTTSVALARALGIDESLLVRILASYVDDGRIVQRSGYYATLDFVPALTAEQRAFFEPLLATDPAQRFLPHELPDVVTELRRSRISGIAQAFDTLVATGILVKVGDALYTGRQVAEIRAALEGAIRRSGTLTMAAFRDVVGTSRKYAVPLLEWFDATGVTVRSGDVRVLRERAVR
ncbi:MAG TPA: selenocysteine-specific translation elongation factor [Candidatus Binatia bacterium]|nr:selenocysteine-specific translation elongation factor [Candidatus Binatia bacterium]